MTSEGVVKPRMLINGEVWILSPLLLTENELLTGTAGGSIRQKDISPL